MSSQSNNGHPSIVHPDYMTIYKIERDFDYAAWHRWFRANNHVPLLIIVVYLALIVPGRRWMQNREPFRLRGILVGWNIILAAFSTLSFVRAVPELFYVLGKPNGFHESVCVSDGISISTVFWGMVFTLLKVVELGDTAFIVLRKQKLIFLHWYHHATVLIYTWWLYPDIDAAIRWCLTMNAFAHSLMYSYYALRAMGIKVPTALAISITTCQLTQMFIAVGVNSYSVYARHFGAGCQTETNSAVISILLYASYAALFCNYFARTYLNKKDKLV